MAAALVLYRQNDNLIVLPNVTDAKTGALVEDMQIHATLYTRDGQIADQSFNGITMEGQSDKPGTYMAVVSYGFAPPPGLYYAIFGGYSSDGKTLRIRQRVEVRDREAR